MTAKLPANRKRCTHAEAPTADAENSGLTPLAKLYQRLIEDKPSPKKEGYRKAQRASRVSAGKQVQKKPAATSKDSPDSSFKELFRETSSQSSEGPAGSTQAPPERDGDQTMKTEHENDRDGDQTMIKETEHENDLTEIDQRITKDSTGRVWKKIGQLKQLLIKKDFLCLKDCECIQSGQKHQLADHEAKLEI